MKRAMWSGWKMQATLAFHPGSSGSIGAANFSLDSTLGTPYRVILWRQPDHPHPPQCLTSSVIFANAYVHYIHRVVSAEQPLSFAEFGPLGFGPGPTSSHPFLDAL